LPDPIGLPTPSFSLSTLINRYKNAEPAKYSLAYSRLGRQPMIFSESPEQAKQLIGTDLGRSYQVFGKAAPFDALHDAAVHGVLTADPAAGPLADPVRKLYEGGEPVSVVAPYKEPVVVGRSKSGKGGRIVEQGTPSGVPLHEAVHSYMGSDRVPVNLLFTKLEPDVRGRITDTLARQGYPVEAFVDEIPARLAAGQFDRLGLSREEGQKLWQTYLDMYTKMSPEKANRLRLYTKGRTGTVDPSLGTSTLPPEPQAK